MRGLPWSVSAHAKDIWTSEPWEATEKLATVPAGDLHGPGPAAPARAGAKPERLNLVYHGLDFAHLPAPPAARSRRDGSDAADPVVVLSIGRKVEKKGYGDLLDALAKLPKTLAWRFEHVAR